MDYQLFNSKGKLERNQKSQRSVEMYVQIWTKTTKLYVKETEYYRNNKYIPA